MELVIDSGARKHGVPDEDMLHAYRNPIRTFDLENDFTMFVGADRAGRLIEVGFVASDDGTVVIIHAMRPARSKYM